MFHTILVAIDGSRFADAALAQAIDLAGREGAKLTLFTAWQHHEMLPTGSTSTTAEGELTLNVEEERHARAVLARARKRVPRSVEMRTRIVRDDPGRAIVGEIERGGYDLVVVGSCGCGEGMIRPLVMGSVSHHVLHHSPVTVMVVRTGAEAMRLSPTVEAGRMGVPAH